MYPMNYFLLHQFIHLLYAYFRNQDYLLNRFGEFDVQVSRISVPSRQISLLTIGHGN